MITDRLKKPGLIYRIFLLAVALVCSILSVNAVDRYTVSSGNWGNPMIWSATPGGAPGAGIPDKQDDVFIENGHIIAVTENYECASVTFTGALATLTVSSPATLSVKNSITLNKLTSNNSECYLAGTGTLLCAWIAVGSGTNPPPADPSSSLFTHTFTSGIASLSLSVKGAPRNDLIINSYIGGTSHFRNGIFNLESGVLTIDGQIITSNPDAGCNSTFSLATGSQSGALFLNGRPSPFILSGTGTNTINLNGSASLVNYCYAGAQTTLGTVYNNLTLSGSGAKTLTGVSINGILSMEGLATAAGAAPVYNSLSALRYKGSAAQTTGIEFPDTFSAGGGIIIDNNNGVILNSNRTISSKLTFISGRINTAANTLIITSPATVEGAGAGKYVNGNLQKGIATGTSAKIFEIGDASVYAPVALAFTGTINNEGNITAKTTPGDHPNLSSSTFNSGVTVNRYWTLVNSGVSGFISYSSTFTFVTGDIDPGADFNYFYVGNYNASGWTYPAAGTLTSVSTQATGMNSFGDFQIGELPISSFRSSQSGNWDLISTWEAFNGNAWIAANGTPSSTAGYVTVRSSHTVTNTSSVTVDQVIIESGGRLNINSEMTVNDGTAIDFTVNGILDCASANLTGNGSFLLNSFADLIIRSPDGITSSGAAGNIQTAIRTFSNWGNFTYNSTASQVTGSGLPAIVNNITIENTAGVNLTGSLSVDGTMNLNAGAFTVGPNTLTFLSSNTPVVRTSGTITTSIASDLSFGTPSIPTGDAFTIPAGTFTAAPAIKNLSIYRTGGVTLNEQGLSVNGIVLCNGPLTTNGNLTLLSSSSGTALIDGSGTGEITGNVTMQRYLPSGFGYKYISSPFRAAAVGQLSDDIDLSAAFPVFYGYNEGSATSGWVTYVTATNLLTPLLGFAANFGSLGAPLTFDMTGEVNNGPLSIAVNNNNYEYTKGFNLTGNPYPSPVNWDAPAGWTKSNIDNALYYFKASTTDEYGGTYSTYINGISSDGQVSSVIPSMQGFFVHVSDGSYPVNATLGIDNFARVTDLTHPFSKSEGKGSMPLVRLGANFADNTASTDPMVIYLNEKAETGFDPQLDALKMLNTDDNVPDLYSISTDGRKLSINALPEIPDAVARIPLGIRINKEGIIAFRIIDAQGQLAGDRIYITDLATESDHDLTNNKEFRVYLDRGEYNDRFCLNLTSPAKDVIDNSSDDDLFSVYSSASVLKGYFDTHRTGPGVLSVISLTGQVLFVKRIVDSGYNEFNPGIKSGIYIVTFKSDKYRSSRKIFIKN